MYLAVKCNWEVIDRNMQVGTAVLRLLTNNDSFICRSSHSYCVVLFIPVLALGSGGIASSLYQFVRL